MKICYGHLSQWFALVLFCAFHQAALVFAQSGNPHEYADLAEKTAPSVAGITVKIQPRLALEERERLKQYEGLFSDEMRKNMVSPEDAFSVNHFGSGVIVSAEGYILTCWHLVGDADRDNEITVSLPDGSEVTGDDVRVVAGSELENLTLLKINRSRLHPLAWGDSDKLRIGEKVLAVSRPPDRGLTVSDGIVNGKNRATRLGGQLESSAATPIIGSGGALVDMSGALAGITWISQNPAANIVRFKGKMSSARDRGITQSIDSEARGWVIPARDLRRFFDKASTQGKVLHGYIGIKMMPPGQDSPEKRKMLGLPEDRGGVLVLGTMPGSPAQHAGVKEGDLIIAADGKPVTDTTGLLGIIARMEPGETVRLSLLRVGSGAEPDELSLSIKVAERPTNRDLAPRRKAPAPLNPGVPNANP